MTAADDRKVIHLDEYGAPARTVHLKGIAGIRPKKSKWVWTNRIPLGQLTLLAGREGIGKSTVAYQLLADITRGRLEGEHHGQPRNVAICCTEDDMAHTIVPRLLAAGADMRRVFSVEVTATSGFESELSLPRDVIATEHVLADNDVAVLLLDPLMSRLSASLDTHKDGEVRQALEPLVRVAQRTGTAVIGLVHVNKGGAKDPASAIMGSRAFVAVARAVLFTMVDLDDERVRLLGLIKSNLGPLDMPVKTFEIESVVAGQDEDGQDVRTGKVRWGEDRQESMNEVFEAADAQDQADSTTAEIDDWLRGLLVSRGGAVDAAEAFKLGKADGFPESTLKRARKRIGAEAKRMGFGQGSVWRYDPSKDRRR
jgi:hypothetical protein